MDESSRTVKVRVEVKNADGRLLAGMFANVKLFLPGADEALAVPRGAVLEDEGRSFVFVHHQGDYYVRRPVTVGRTWAGWVEVKKGLQPGADRRRRGRLPHEVRRPALEDGRGLRGLRGTRTMKLVKVLLKNRLLVLLGTAAPHRRWASSRGSACRSTPSPT